jgi:uncharacterized membrane protein HdeD (DUF308 family)
MKEKMKDLRLNITMSALFTIVIGILLLLYPAESLSTIGRVIAIIIIITGLLIVISQILESGKNTMGMVVGGVLALVGVWMFTAPTAIASIIPMAIGVLMVVHGLQDLSMAIEAVKLHAPRPWLPFILAIVNIAFGAICFCGAFNILTVATRVIGVMLIYDGLSDIGIVHKVRKATKDNIQVVDSTIVSEEDIQ